ncbi:MAG: penicillin-binding protein, partial [Acidimicrobiia bacterium]|nr:penicillin-binding protein [Acidimicrobiia bacterium]
MASTIHQLEKQDKRGRWFVALAILLSISVLTASWVGLFTFMTATAAHGSFIDLETKYIPEVDGEALNFPDLSRVSKVYASDGTLLAELHDGRVSEPVRYEEIPQTVVDAVLAAEDSDFFEHDGIDWSAIMSAAIDNLGSDTQRGGSTITQQVVKKTFVGDELTLKRKIREAVTAIELERRYSKEQILEFYMNSVYFGSSAYGINAAAHEFFRKDLNQLSIAEAATLAVLPRNPTTYNPRRNAELTIERRNDVIAEMVDSGFITAEEGDAAVEQPMFIAPHETFSSPADHVVAEVKRQLLSDPRFAVLGETREERKHSIFGCPADDEVCEGGGGLHIHLTIDLDLQNTANGILQTWLPPPTDP